MTQWHAGERSWLPRLCCHCEQYITPRSRHHRIESDGQSRRIHYARCPVEPEGPDPFPVWSQTDVIIERVNQVLAAVGMLAFAAAAIFLAALVLGFTP